MSRKSSNQMKVRILLSICIIALAVFGLLFWNNITAIIEKPVVSQEVKPTAAMETEEKVGNPVRIAIPSIDLDAAIEKVALTADGSMDVPKQSLNTGWYELGPRPGEIGSAVIDGHVDWVDGAAAVFTNLNKVKPGDKITIQNDMGILIPFVVREIRIFDATADATDVFISNDGKAHLNLITCGGAWDKSTNQYSKRLVVFADKE